MLVEVLIPLGTLSGFRLHPPSVGHTRVSQGPAPLGAPKGQFADTFGEGAGIADKDPTLSIP